MKKMLLPVFAFLLGGCTLARATYPDPFADPTPASVSSSIPGVSLVSPTSSSIVSTTTNLVTATIVAPTTTASAPTTTIGWRTDCTTPFNPDAWYVGGPSTDYSANPYGYDVNGFVIKSVTDVAALSRYGVENVVQHDVFHLDDATHQSYNTICNNGDRDIIAYFDLQWDCHTVSFEITDGKRVWNFGDDPLLAIGLTARIVPGSSTSTYCIGTHTRVG